MSRGPNKRVTDIEIIQALEETIQQTGDPVAKPDEVADLIDIGVQQCRDRMRELADRGFIEYKKSGSGKVWWVDLSEPVPHALD